MILTSIPGVFTNRRKIARYITMSLITLFLIAGPTMVNISCSGPASEPLDNNQRDQAVTDTHKETGDTPARPNFSKCGDGICDEFERSRGICPQDCASDTGTGAEKIAEDKSFGEYGIKMKDW